MLLALIIVCEIAFWVFLVLGLTARYLLRWDTASKVLLICVPLIDLVLLVASIIDLRNGSSANFAHGLAALYLGFTIVFGPSLIHWADQRFAHHFADGPAPDKPPEYGWANARYEWLIWGKGVLASAIAALLILGAILMVDDPSKTQLLKPWFPMLAVSLLFWLVAWPLWLTVFPKKPATKQGPAE